ncbi:MAG: hypothetical protein QXT34_02500 [Candidatus Aenigmatarchaeota archaeon]
MKSKGQAALEFLMTYGWAIMLVIVVVGALYATGMLKPCRWVGVQIRDFPPSQFGVQHIATNATHMVIELTNNNLRKVNITNVIAEVYTDGSRLDESKVNVSFEREKIPFELEVGGKVKTYISFGELSSGTCIDIKLAINYTIDEVPTSVTGRISHSV